MDLWVKICRTSVKFGEYTKRNGTKLFAYGVMFCDYYYNIKYIILFILSKFVRRSLNTFRLWRFSKNKYQLVVFFFIIRYTFLIPRVRFRYILCTQQQYYYLYYIGYIGNKSKFAYCIPQLQQVYNILWIYYNIIIFTCVIVVIIRKYCK